MKKVITIDLGAELAEIREAAEGARVLADTLVYDAAPNAEAARLMPRRIAAILNVVAERVRAVERACNGSANPRTIRAHYNDSLGDDGTSLREWDEGRHREELAREQRRLDFEHRRGRRRRRS